MRLSFLGHACFLAESADGLRVLMDPYRPGALGGRISHAAISEPADLVVVTHYHEDHGWVSCAPGATVVDGPGTFAGLEFRTVWLPHDGCHGSQMGYTRMMAFTMDGVSVLHPGDLGRAPTDDDLAQLGDIHLLLLPVGGRFTLPIAEAVSLQARLLPRWTVPMHYRSAKVDLDMAPLEDYLAAIDGAPLTVSSCSVLDCDSAQLTGAPEIVLLPPAM